MHELGIMQDVLASAIRTADENNGNKVTKITLKIGVLSGVLPHYMQSYFDVISKGTKAEGAELVIETEPALFHCGSCDKKTVFREFGADFVCGHCGNESMQLLLGKTFQLVSVAII